MGKANDLTIKITQSATPDFAPCTSKWWDWSITDKKTGIKLKYGKRSGQKRGVQSYCESLLQYCKESQQWHKVNQRRKYNTI